MVAKSEKNWLFESWLGKQLGWKQMSQSQKFMLTVELQGQSSPFYNL